MVALSFGILRDGTVLGEAVEPDTKTLCICNDRLLCILNGLFRWPWGKGTTVEQKLLPSDAKAGPFPSDSLIDRPCLLFGLEAAQSWEQRGKQGPVQTCSIEAGDQ